MLPKCRQYTGRGDGDGAGVAGEGDRRRKGNSERDGAGEGCPKGEEGKEEDESGTVALLPRENTVAATERLADQSS